MTIRPAEEKDLKACELLGRITEFELPDGRFMKAEWLKEYLDPDFYLVMEEDNKIIGFVAGDPLKGNGAMLMFLTIDKNIRNKGLGTILLKEFEKRIKKRGVAWILLYGPTQNKQTLKFYQTHGYTMGGTYHEFLKEF